MKQRVQPFLHTSAADGQTIPGRARPAVGQRTLEQGRNRSLAGLRLLNQRPAMPDSHQSTALLHAMQLTSGDPSLQSP